VDGFCSGGAGGFCSGVDRSISRLTRRRLQIKFASNIEVEFPCFRFDGAKHQMPVSCLCTPEPLTAFSRFALVVGHPGHELRVFGWMSQNKPEVFVITDGSGSHDISRILSTEKTIRRVGAVPGELFGCISDAEIYAAILGKNFPWFLRLLDGLADSFIKNRIDFVAGDATEGFNPTHDLCRSLVNAAVLMAERATGKTIANYEFYLSEWEQNREEPHGGRCLHLRLDDELLRDKLNSAEDYIELRSEVRKGIAQRGREYFRTECLRKITGPLSPCQDSGKALYETWGEQRVAKGKYESVIRFQDHILPIMGAIREHSVGASVDASSSSLRT